MCCRLNIIFYLRLFTHDMFKEVAQPVKILQCQDDLAVLDGNLVYPFGGR